MSGGLVAFSFPSRSDPVEPYLSAVSLLSEDSLATTETLLSLDLLDEDCKIFYVFGICTELFSGEDTTGLER